MERALQKIVSMLRVSAFLALAAIPLACSSAPSTSPAPTGPLGKKFEAASVANGVPRDLMIAIAQTEGALAMPAMRDVNPDAAVPAAGPLQLRRGRFDSLARGAALMGTTELALRQDTDLALEAGARVLADVGARLGAGAELASWEATLEEMSGYLDTPHRRHYAHRVFATLARGGTFTGRDGERMTIAPHDLPPSLTLDLTNEIKIQTPPADYGPAEWFPTPQANKWTPGRGAGPIDRIVIHDTEGGWDASVATLQNDGGKSVQYIVGQDGRVGQFVHEGDTAWHAGNWFYNQKSVGIEHVGYYTQSYPEAEYAASAELVKYLTTKYNIAKDRAHIIGHDQIPNGNVMAEDSAACSQSPSQCETGSSYGGAGNHRDPGDWEWCLYMPRFGGTCKCDDIWPLWNCSADHKKAFRCNNGNVEIATCDGPGACESKPVGVDDVCHQAAPQPDAGSSGADAGGTSGGDDAGTTPPRPPVGSDSGAGTPPPPSSGDNGGDAPPQAAGDSGGCNASGGGADLGALGAIALAALAFRRRRGARATS